MRHCIEFNRHNIVKGGYGGTSAIWFGLKKRYRVTVAKELFQCSELFEHLQVDDEYLKWTTHCDCHIFGHNS